MSEKIQTRAQQDLSTAMRCIQGVVDKEAETRKIYGGLCHSFPVLVQQCGLCQAVAFSEAKAARSSPRAEAHRLLIEHVAAILDLSEKALVDHLREIDTLDYMDSTRRVLSAWIYFKRFAVSQLKVESAQAAQEGSDGD